MEFNLPETSSQQKRKAKRKRSRDDPELEHLNSLSWNPSLFENDDPFSLVVGSNELEGDQVINVKDDNDEEDIDEMEFYAWNELKLHPLLMKAIYKLGFKEPTPIQKACIPAAAHERKMLLGLLRLDLGNLLPLVCPFCNGF